MTIRLIHGATYTRVYTVLRSTHNCFFYVGSISEDIFFLNTIYVLYFSQICYSSVKYKDFIKSLYLAGYKFIRIFSIYNVNIKLLPQARFEPGIYESLLLEFAVAHKPTQPTLLIYFFWIRVTSTLCLQTL